MKQNELPHIDFHHHLPVQIRFNDVDLFGHVNNTVYLQFFDMGKYRYFTNLVPEGLGADGTAPVIVNINCDFLEPTLMDEQLEVLTAITDIANSSMTLEQRIVASNGHVKCVARTIMVNLDLSTGRPATVSDKWRRLIWDFEGKS